MKKILLLALFFLGECSLVLSMDRVEDNESVTTNRRPVTTSTDVAIDINAAKKDKVPKLSIPRPIPGDLSPTRIINVLADLSGKRETSETSGSGSTSNRSDGKQVLQTVEEIHQLVREQSALHEKRKPIRRKPGTNTVEIASDHSQESVHSIDPHYLQTNELRQNLEDIINAIAQQYHIDPALFIECRFRYHGERNKTPRPFEEEEWRKIMNNRPDKYERMIKELLFEMMKAHLKNIPQDQPEEQEERPSDFIDTHMGVLRNRIDNQEDALARKNRLILWGKVFAGLQTIIMTGMTIWASYAQSHTTSIIANCTH